ncbi:thioredoxin-dependent thiol peroxidase [Candidatus Micrarchaeota archaeon]|nr:thioredoxin-dependent thiol peroxidase [Candidatus Micrarchaeota archaeon]
MLNEGDKAPAFTTRDTNGKTISSSQFKGKRFVLYFYPRDDTPGCTIEACSFRDHFKEFKKRKIEILGVSMDNETSHQKFSKRFQLPFPLLVDEHGEIAQAYGAYGEKKFLGRTFQGVKRMTFIIDKKGRIAKIYWKVKTFNHAQEVMEFAQTLQ